MTSAKTWSLAAIVAWLVSVVLIWAEAKLDSLSSLKSLASLAIWLSMVITSLGWSLVFFFGSHWPKTRWIRQLTSLGAFFGILYLDLLVLFTISVGFGGSK